VTKWQVVVHNDSVNTFSVVADVLTRVAGLTPDEAIASMWRIHNEGSLTIASAGRDAAESMVARLHGFGLDATVHWTES
jgi:ATP-dependent Clp protease adaptor protein ClpS